jgi:3-dehydroquinate synthase
MTTQAHSSIYETQLRTRTSYVVGQGCVLDAWPCELLDELPAVVVIDEHVDALFSPRLSALTNSPDCLGVLRIPGGEPTKSLPQLQTLIEFVIEAGLPKHGRVIAIGGGTVCDVAALAATLVRRGVGLVLIPTTLLAQLDAAVGGKNGINIGSHKNILGQFFHPQRVVCDAEFLSTLPQRELVCGLAEAIKVLAVGDLDTYRHHAAGCLSAAPGRYPTGALESLVRDALGRKLDLLSEDPYECSSQRLLNYGHAFSHVFEERSRYALAHGEAVLIGMLIENEVSRGLGIGRDVDGLQDLIAGLLTPACRRHWLPFSVVNGEIERLRKARRGLMNLVCIETPGRAQIVDNVSEPLLASAWAGVESRLLESNPEQAETRAALGVVS